MVTELLVGARLESTAFSVDDVRIRELRGREAISELFVFEVDLDVLAETSFDARATLGAEVSIVFELEGDPVRRVHGIVSEVIEGLRRTTRETSHRLRIVPRLHRLSLSAACEVFLDRSVIDIARELLGRAGLQGPDVAVHLTQPPAARDFRLQYAESDLAFVSRLLERAGIAYSFDHASGKDVLVLSDTGEVFRPAAGPEAIVYTGRADERGITDLHARTSMMTGRHVVHDYDPDHPKLDLRTECVLEVPFGGEVIDFCAGHATPQEGQKLAKIRAESHLALHDGFEGVCNLPYVEAARTIAVEGHPSFGTDRLLVLWVEHRLTQAAFQQSEGMAKTSYTSSFRAVPASRHYRPEPRTPWPRIAGFVHAVTDAPPVGATGRIAELDDEGRYTVRFLFDKANMTRRPVSSARVRMMQPHAGPGYGMHFPLKPGVEVFVAFIEGDPDRPLIAGSVPNPLTASPVARPNAQMNRIETESGIRITMKDA